MGMIEYTDLTLMYQNEALYKLCESKLGIEAPNFKDINQIIA